MSSGAAHEPNVPERRYNRWTVYVVRGLFIAGLLIFLLVVMTTPPVRTDQPGWSDAAEMPAARGELTAAVGVRESGCDEPPCDVVVALGGFASPFSTTTRAEAYLIDEDRWISLPDLPSSRHHLAASAFDDGTIVVTGGAGSGLDWDPTDDVWALEPDSEEWTSLEPLPEARWGHRLVNVDDQLILVGGYGGDTTLIYSRDDGWSTGAPIPVPRDHLGAVVVDDEVWVIGGRDDQIKDRVDIYDPANDSWRDGPPLPEPTSAAVVGLIDRTLVVVAGEDDSVFGGGIIRESWMLDVDDPDAGWQPLVKPPEDMHGAGDAVIGSDDEARLLIIGGASRHGAFSPLDWSDRVMVLEDPQPREDATASE
jgi:N-acetylneuraminic acid mutarotase